MDTGPLPSTAVSRDLKPLELITRVTFPVEETVKEKLPARSVCVPVVEPFTITLADPTGTPFSSETVPLIVRFCACTTNGITNSSAIRGMIFFIWRLFWVYQVERRSCRSGIQHL